MKDVPAQLPPGLCLGAVSLREDARDCWISKNNIPFFQLPSGAKSHQQFAPSGPDSRLRPDVEVVPLRGNLGTRLRKLD